jgi:hypothetical protein
MQCAVCREWIKVGAERYPNDWERVRKRFACCSDACASRFQPDEHWIPSVWPPALADAEQRRLLAVAAGRLRNGDQPKVVLREMLQAGVSVAGLRRVVGDQRGSAAQHKRTLGSLNLLGRLLGAGSVRTRFDPRDVGQLDAAFDILDEWELLRVAD